MLQIAFMVVSALAVLWMNKSEIGGLWSKVRGSAASTGRPEAIAALDVVIGFFDAEGCKEGGDAARKVGSHFYHSKTDAA